MVLTGFGLGLVASPTNTDALGRVEAVKRDQASGLVQTVRQLGGTLGVAVIGAVVLGVDPAGPIASSPRQFASAIEVGFMVATVAFAAALAAGWRLLARERLVAQESGRSAPVAAVG